MSLYGATPIDSIEKIGNGNELLEMYLVDDILRQNSDDIRTFCESEQAKILQEKAVLRKSTMMRLSKQDDFQRRVKLAAYQLAKEANDPEFDKLKKYTALKKQSANKIMKKYGVKAEKVAKVGQKNYIKTASKVKASAEKKDAK